METCVCGSGNAFAECCEPFLKGDQYPETAEKLLRSRYTAYNLLNMDYIYHTTHESKQKDFDRADTKAWAAKSEWYQLEIIDTKGGGVSDDQGKIEFIAHYKHKNTRQLHHELAEFRKESGKWYFFDGEVVVPQTVRREGHKVGRNEPCPCGSGKKFKKCCG